jgi:hypothetical protein
MDTGSDTVIRIHKQSGNDWEDLQLDFGLEDFGGCVPAIGDMILEPGVRQGLDRRDANNRKLWTVVQRVFNPRDVANYVVLVVEEKVPTGRECTMVSIR